MSTHYNYVLGFEEPDCAAGGGSAGIDVGTAAALWNQVVAPKGVGALLGSPSMCSACPAAFSPHDAER
jgi:hypothetical protein